MKKIRLGQLGIGHNHGEEKMKSYRRFPELYELVGVAEPDEVWLNKRKHLKGYEGLPFMSEEELLSKCDAVLVETRVKDLVPAAMRCIKAGKHIHMDKPAGETLDDYEEMLMLAKEKGLVVQLGYMYRNNEAVKYALDMVRSGKLGEIYNMDVHMSTCHPYDFRADLTQYKGATMYIFGCHLIDLVYTIMGKPNSITPILQKTGQDGLDLYDNCLALMHYDKGTSVIRTSSVEVNGWGRRQIVICGSEGTIEIKPIENPRIITYATKANHKPWNDVKEIVELPPVTPGRYDDMAKDFALFIHGEKENPYSYEYELELHRMVLQACNLI